MADTKVSALTELTVAPDPTDELLVVDKSDTSMAASGTDKRIQWTNVAGAFIANSIGTTKGDSIAFTGSAAPVRVPVGADAYVYTAASVVGYGTTWARPPAFAYFSYFADAGNVTTGETDLLTDTIPSNTLTGNGQTLEIIYAGKTAANANNKTFKVYFAGTAIFTSAAIAANTHGWRVEATIIRVSNTVVRYSVQMVTSASATAGTVYASQGSISSLNLSTTGYIAKITGTATSTNDIVATLGSVRWMTAP